MVLLYLGATHRLGRRDLAFLAPLAGVMVLALVDATRSSHPYLSLLYRSSPSQEALLGLGAAAGLAATVALTSGMTALQSGTTEVQRGLAFAAFHMVIRMALGLAAVVAGAIRDALDEVTIFNVWTLSGTRLILLASGILVMGSATAVRAGSSADQLDSREP